MPKVYVVIDEMDRPIVWRVHDVLASVRTFEDGHVAEAHRLLAIKLGYGSNLRLLKLGSQVEAVKYSEQHIREEIWYHLLPLSYGYDDKYAYNPEQPGL